MTAGERPHRTAGRPLRDKKNYWMGYASICGGAGTPGNAVVAGIKSQTI